MSDRFDWIPFERTSREAFDGKLPRCEQRELKPREFTIPPPETAKLMQTTKYVRAEFREYVHEPVTAEWGSTGMHYVRARITRFPRTAIPLDVWLRIGGYSWGPTPLAVDGAAYRRRTRRRKS